MTRNAADPLIYAYCQGVRSSRQIEQRCVKDVAFRVLCAQEVPDTRRSPFPVASRRFRRVVHPGRRSPRAAGMARFGTVAERGHEGCRRTRRRRQRQRGLAGPGGRCAAARRGAARRHEDAETRPGPSERRRRTVMGSGGTRACGIVVGARAACAPAGARSRPRTRRASGPAAAAGERGAAAVTRPGRRVGGGAHPTWAASAVRGPRASGPGGRPPAGQTGSSGHVDRRGTTTDGATPGPGRAAPSRAARPTGC